MPSVVDISPSDHQSEYDGSEGVFANLGTNNGFEMTWCGRHQEYEFNPVGMADSTGHFDCGVGEWDDCDYYANWRDGQDDDEAYWRRYAEDLAADAGPQETDPDYDLHVAGRALDLVPATYLNGHRDLAEQF